MVSSMKLVDVSAVRVETGTPLDGVCCVCVVLPGIDGCVPSDVGSAVLDMLPTHKPDSGNLSQDNSLGHSYKYLKGKNSKKVPSGSRAEIEYI